MTEDRLAQLLKELTPQPPRAIALADLTPAAKHARARLWRAPIAAAIIAAVVITTTVLALRGRTSDDPQPVTHRPTAPVSATWDAQPLADQQADALIGTSVSLYSVRSENSQTTIARIDPATGRTLATVSYVDDDGTQLSLRPPVLAGGSLWIASDPDSRGVITLRRFDSTTLASQAAIEVTLAGAAKESTSLAAGPSGDLYVAAGQTVAVIDSGSGQIRTRFDVGAGYVAGIAVAPDNSRFYLGVMPDSTGALVNDTELQVRDPRTGAMLARLDNRHDQFGGIQAMMASAGGVWIANAVGGNGEQVLFVPADGSSARSPAASQGGGGVVALATVANNTVWIGGGPGGLECADPVSGTSRASTVLPNGDFISDVAYASGSAFAIEYSGGAHNIVRINPPAACTP